MATHSIDEEADIHVFSRSDADSDTASHQNTLIAERRYKPAPLECIRMSYDRMPMRQKILFTIALLSIFAFIVVLIIFSRMNTAN